MDIQLGMCDSKPIAIMTSQIGPSSLVSLPGLLSLADNQLVIDNVI